MIGNCMNLRLFNLASIALVVVLILGACTPKATPIPIDIAGTIAVQLASEMLTQTVAAYSPTPPHSPTPLPATDTPIPTNTAILETSESQSVHKITVLDLENNVACRSGPDDSYELISYIHPPKEVKLLGIGNVPGWYIIRNPYFNAPCWLPAASVEIDPAMDLSIFPVIAPGQIIYETP